MLHFDMKKFSSHPSTNDMPFRKVDVIYPGAPIEKKGNEIYHKKIDNRVVVTVREGKKERGRTPE